MIETNLYVITTLTYKMWYSIEEIHTRDQHSKLEILKYHFSLG